MTFDDWRTDYGDYLNDSDDAARAAKLMARRAWDAAVERCAKVCEPAWPRPCHCERCDCGNAAAALMVAKWDEAAALARRIRGA